MFLGLSFVLCFAAHAEAVVQVFGLNLGGKIAAPTGICPASDGPVRAMCWVSKPSVAPSGTRQGTVRMPNTVARPIWAEFGVFSLLMGRDGLLKSLRVETFDGAARGQIVESISARFGPPTESTFWLRPDIAIEVLCAPDKCWTTFQSAADYQAQAAELAARRARNAARPVSP